MPRPSHALVLAAAAAVVALATAAPASAKTVWLCTPQTKHDPCDYGLTTTVIKPDDSRSTQRFTAPRRPKADCFYVYPTVSDQKTENATLAKDPEIKAIATYQASRFQLDCRVWAPMYRQVTLQGIANPGSVSADASKIAYRSARAAFDDYVKHDNHGRGFVLIGHSQGSFVLKQLIADEIDKRPALRRRMVSALLLGGNVTSKEFKHVKACSKPGQTGCIVAWSMFHDPPPANSLFGRTTLAGQHVVCTSPGALGGSSALVPYQPSLPFPGTIGIGLAIFEQGNAPSGVTTPWFSQPGRYTGACATTADGASYLKVDGDPQPTPTPDATWGLHLGDVNLAMGNLLTIARKQIGGYLRTRSR
jgi:Protein of unknown function (DUF3089)